MKKYIFLLTGFLPLLASAQLVMSGNYNVILSGGTSAAPTKLVLTDAAPSGITRLGTGNIISESEYNMVDWYIGTSTGTFVVPFGDVSLDALPVTLNIGTAGTGSGDIKFSTYHTASLNSSSEPSDVGNMMPFFLPGSPSNSDNSYNVADRFYVLDANSGYTTKPTASNITFSYIHGTANTEIGTPNTLTESRLMAQRYNSTSNTWNDWYAYGCTDAFVSNVGTVQTGPVPAVDLFRSWSLWDNTMSLPLKVTSINGSCSTLSSATVNVYGGKSPYTYAWSPSGGSSSTASSLSAGSYTITVKDFNGCSSSAKATITIPAALTVTAVLDSNSAACIHDGMAAATPHGGTSPYTYSWSPGGNSNAIATGLSAGNCTVTLTDNNGCSATATIAIGTVAAVTATEVVNSNTTECGNTGSATITGHGGRVPYIYSWSPGGSTTSSVTTLSAGTYTVTVKDKNGCAGSVSVTITAPPRVTATSVVNTNTSECANNGSATVTASSGTTPYTYLWAPAGGTTSTASALSTGTYTITVTDKNGCSVTNSITITQPPILSVSASVSANVKCSGINTGSATATAGGGTTPYTYLWSPGGSTSSNATGLSAGTYSITVTDKNTCSVSASVVITQPAALIVNATTTANIPCAGGNTGAVSASASGGTSPYTYLWSGGGTNSTKTGLSAGTYTITLTDKNGCTASGTTIVQPAFNATTSVNNIKCNGGTGSATGIVSGGTSPYTYLWNPGGSTSSNITGLSAGTYTVTATDNTGCSKTAKATITAPTALTVTTLLDSNTAVCINDGAATATPHGGTSPYTYAWSPGGNSNAIATGLSAGNYTVTLTDNNGCNATATIAIGTVAAVTATEVVNSNTTECGNTGSATITGHGGRVPYTYSWSPGGSTTSSVTNLSAGTYTVTVKDKNGCAGSVSVTITAPPRVTATSVVNTNTSECANNGSATVTASSGTTPYTYLWAPAGGTTSTASGLSTGTYTITVTDKNGCSITNSITITQPPILSVSTSVSANVKCSGINTGSATATPGGGTSPYTYLWSPGGSTSSNATGLSAGTYSITVTDKNTCSVSASVVITQPTALVVSASTTANIACAGGNTGAVSASASGGTSPYTYLWSGGGTNSTKTGLSAGTYTITLTDKNGCTASGTTIVQPAFSATTSVNNIKCNGGTGSATGIVSGGTSPYTYLWNPGGSTSSNITGLSAGTYTVTATDNTGCSKTAKATITAPTALTVTTLLDSNTAVCINDGAATATPHGGTSPYTYAWSPGGNSNAIATGLSAGTYTVTLTDNNGCSATATIAIGTVAAVTATKVVNSNSSECANSGSATITAGGGRAPYTYSWSPGGSTTSSVTGLSAGTYTVTVKDKNGCSATVTVTITKPAALTLALSSQSCVGNNNGTATVSTAGGTTPYTYGWTGGGTSATHTGLTNGSYTVTVTDKNGCTATVQVTMNCTSSPHKVGEMNPDTSNCCPVNEISVYPNPNNGNFTIAGLIKGEKIELYDYAGQKLKTFIANSENINLNISDRANGVYLIRVTENGVLVGQKKLILQK